MSYYSLEHTLLLDPIPSITLFRTIIFKDSVKDIYRCTDQLAAFLFFSQVATEDHNVIVMVVCDNYFVW